MSFRTIQDSSCAKQIQFWIIFYIFKEHPHLTPIRMPLYMDYHVFPEVTIEEVKLGHMADQAIQDQYKVTYHQFWVNEAAGTVFCLIEAPDMESCARVHREAHGNVACNLIEVERGLYDVFMGNGHVLEQGLVKHPDGTVDTGYRFVLVIQIIGNTDVTDAGAYKNLKLPEEAKRMTADTIDQYYAKRIRNLGDDSIIATFINADRALRCALDIQSTLKRYNGRVEDAKWDIRFTMGLGAGQPVTDGEGIFEEAIKGAQRLCLAATEGELLLGHLVEKLCERKEEQEEEGVFRVLGKQEERFLDRFFNLAEAGLSDHAIGIDELSMEIGVSRPQLYRKVVALTGRSPLAFIRDLKMKRALDLLRDRQWNISEIAMELGYNNPSYFSKCFQEKFGVPPSRVEV